MALNFLGLGFNFGSQDKGLADSIKSTSSGIADIGKGILQASAASAKMAFKPPNFGPALSSAQSLASDMKLTTTGIEAFGVASNKVTSAGLAGLNLTNKQLRNAQKQIASGSLDMNIGAEGMTQSFVALKQAGVDIEKVGFTGGLKEFQKFVEVTGVDATKFAGSIGRLTNQMGFQEKEAGDLVKATAAIGKKFNIGREAVQGMAETVELLNDNSNLLPQNWGKERTAEFVKGATKFAGALTSVGLTSDEAMAASRGLTTALLNSETGLSNLYSGVTKEMPDMALVMTKHLGNAGDAFKALQEDPAAFMQNMGGLVDEVRNMPDMTPDSLNMFRAEMEKTFGKGTMAMFTKQGMGKMGPAMEEASKPIEGQGEILQTLAKHYKDGRTAADRFALAQDRLVTRMKTIDGVMSDQEYLKKYKKNTNLLYDSLNKTAKKGGPIGKMTTMLIEMRTKGIGGALASHSKYGMALAELSNQFAPIITALPGLAAGFAALANPVTLVAAAIGGLYFAFKDLEKGDKSIIRPWLNRLQKEIPNIIAGVKEAFTKALSVVGKVIEYVVANIPWQKVGEVLGQVLEGAAKVALFLFETSLKIGEKLLGMIAKIDWGAIGKKLGGYLAAAASIAVKYIGKFIQALPSMIIKFANIMVSAITGIFDGIGEFLAEKFPKYAKPIMFVFIMLKTAVKAYFAVFKVVWGAIAGIIKGVWNILGDGIAIIGDAANAVIDFFSSSESTASKSANAAAAARMKAAEEEKKRHAAWVSDQHAKGIATKGFVKTHEGVITKSSDAIVKYVKTETGAVKAMIFEANKLQMAQITYSPVKEAADLWKAHKAAMDAIPDGEKAHKKRKALMDEYADKRREYEKKHGVDLHATQQMEIAISRQMSLTKEELKGLEGASSSYAKSITANQTAYGNAMAKEAELINQRWKAGDLTRAQFDEQNTALLKRGALYNELAMQTGDIAKEQYAKVLKAAIKNGEDFQSATQRVASVYAANFTAKTDEILAKLPESMSSMKDEFKASFDEIAKANEQTNAQILFDNKGNLAEGQRLVRENNKVYLAAQDELAAGLETHRNQLASSTETGMRDVMSKITEGMSKVVSETKIKGAEAAGEIQKTIGVSANEAAEMVGTISNLKPKKFRQNMRIVKDEFTKFLKLTVDESKTMMDLSAKYINAFWESSKAGWEEQGKLIQAWSMVAEVAIQKYWTVTVAEAGKAALSFFAFVVQMQGKLVALAKSINLMDILASPSQIDRWAAMVVSALATAFRGGAAADAMIGAAYNKALAMSAVVDKASATPEGADGGGTGLAQAASHSLIAVIDNPKWTEEKSLIPSQLRVMNETLAAISLAMSQPEAMASDKPGKQGKRTNKRT